MPWEPTAWRAILGPLKKPYNLQPCFVSYVETFGASKFQSAEWSLWTKISDLQLSTSPFVEPEKVIPRVRQRLRLLVLADTADKRVAEVWDRFGAQMKV